MLPLILISGFLGAGKTTLMRRALIDARERGLRLWVVVNEFGSVDVDGEILRTAQVESLASLAGGCVCCAGQDEFSALLQEWAGRADRPDAILVETSGLADPLIMLETLAVPPLSERVRVASMVTVVDGQNWDSAAVQVGSLLCHQISLADTVVINKVDLVDARTIQSLKTRLRGFDPQLNVVSAVEGEFDFSPLWDSVTLSKSGSNRANLSTLSGHSHSAHNAHTVFCAMPYPVGKRPLETLLRELESNVWRAKGFVRLRGQGSLFLVQYTGGESESSVQLAPFYVPHGMEEPRLGMVFIGAHLDEERLQQRFENPATLGAF